MASMTFGRRVRRAPGPCRSAALAGPPCERNCQRRRKFQADPHDMEKPPAGLPRRVAACRNVLVAEDDEISALLARAVIEVAWAAVTEVATGTAGRSRGRRAEASRATPRCSSTCTCRGSTASRPRARIRAHERAARQLAPAPIDRLDRGCPPRCSRAALAAGIGRSSKPVAPGGAAAPRCDLRPGRRPAARPAGSTGCRQPVGKLRCCPLPRSRAATRRCRHQGISASARRF